MGGERLAFSRISFLIGNIQVVYGAIVLKEIKYVKFL